MILNVYRIKATHPDLIAALVDRKQSWDVVASDLPSAWRKFCRQRFGDLLPEPAQYDIHFERVMRI